MKMQHLLSGAAAVIALVVAGCGGGGYHPSSASPKGSGGGALLKVVSDPKLGKIITDGNGRTLYDFPIDKGTASVCYGACASLWPPRTTSSRPVARPGASGARTATSKRHDGSTEVTYAGHPLYYSAPDRKQG